MTRDAPSRRADCGWPCGVSNRITMKATTHRAAIAAAVIGCDHPALTGWRNRRRILNRAARLGNDPALFWSSIGSGRRTIGKADQNRVVAAFSAVISIQSVPQPVHLGCDIGRSLGPGLFRPQFLDDPVWLKSRLRIEALPQNFQQLPELAFAGEARAAQDPFDLVVDGGAVHSSTADSSTAHQYKRSGSFEGVSRDDRGTDRHPYTLGLVPSFTLHNFP